MNDKVQIKNCRPFTMIHNDFLDYEGLNSKEKLVMITLMRYDGTAFPSIPKLSKKIGLSERTVRYALKSLEEKNFISRHPRYTADGARMSNSYTITDDPDIWKSETSDELSEEISKQELEEMAELLRAAGYTIQRPTEQTVSNSQAASQEQLSLSDTSDSEEVIPSKNVEEYSMDYLYQYFNYDLICSFKNPYGGLNFLENEHDQKVLDTVFSVLYDMLNDPSAYIQIGQDSIPQAVVKNELLGLTFDAIIGVIDAYNNETEHGAIYDPVSWLRNALYKGSQPHIPDG